jgi:hypothetical protein
MMPLIRLFSLHNGGSFSCAMAAPAEVVVSIILDPAAVKKSLFHLFVMRGVYFFILACISGIMILAGGGVKPNLPGKKICSGFGYSRVAKSKISTTIHSKSSFLCTPSFPSI